MKAAQIQITLVDADSGRAFGEMNSPLDKMPPVFEPGKTTLNLEGAMWVVVRAEPATADGYTQTGRVTVTLEKVKSLSPKGILYTLPTICDTVPAVKSVNQGPKDALPVVTLSPEREAQMMPGTIRPKTARPNGDIFRIHEDYWRQIEFVSPGFREDVAAEMNDIEAIFRDHGDDNRSIRAFTEIHIRSRIPAPIARPFQYDSLASMLPRGSHAYAGIGFGGPASMEADGLIENGFAFQVGPVTVYGLRRSGLVSTLCLHDYGETSISDQAVAAFLEGIMVANDLALVDWCQRVIFPPNAAHLRDYVEQIFY
jgi:hypothetical protein